MYLVSPLLTVLKSSVTKPPLWVTKTTTTVVYKASYGSQEWPWLQCFPPTQVRILCGKGEAMHAVWPPPISASTSYSNKQTNVWLNSYWNHWEEQQFPWMLGSTEHGLNLIMLRSTHIMPQFVHNFHQLKMTLIYLSKLIDRLGEHFWFS